MMYGRSNLETGNGIFELTDICLALLPKGLKDSSSNERNALILNPLIIVYVSRSFTDLRCINSLTLQRGY